MDTGPDGLPDPATEVRVPLHRGARFVVDTQRLWHVVVHNGDAPRYALISSFESGPALDRWIAAAPPVATADLDRAVKFGSNARDALRTLHGPVPPDGSEPHARARARPRPDRQHLDRLGFDEVWIGEHHSGGYEIISSPEVFIAAAAERTKHIRLGQRRQLAAVPPPAAARRPLRAARPPHPRPRHARLRARPADVRRAHARHPGRPAAPAHARGARRDHGAAPRRDRHDGDRLVHAAATRACS